MIEPILLTGRCERRLHRMLRVLEAPDAVVIDADLFCVGREAETWTPMRRRLDPVNGRVSRYGCKCRTSALVSDREIWDLILSGYSRWLIAATNISLR